VSDLVKLIPEIKDWQNQNGKEFGVEDWIAMEGTRLGRRKEI
jgi:hypothetical protein